MHRQHPYAGYGVPPDRKPNSPPGAGSDRRQSAGGPKRGFGPRRGGAPGHYDYENPYGMPQLDNPYAEDAYSYRNGDYGEQNDYELPADGRRGGRPPRRNDEEKAHDPLIEERLQRERPCRTLFIRNIKYETDSADFRRKFEEFGEIKTFFDLISHRGMVFCTYYDMRAAERAKERLQGTELAGRPIDVHYSLPRDDQKSEQNQGVITVTLIDSPTHATIDDMELRRKLTTFGDVKSITLNNGRHDSRLVEFYDLRSADEAHGKLRHQTLQDGVIETDFAPTSDTLPPGPAMQERARQERATHTRERNRGRSRGGKGRGGGGGGGGGYDDRRKDWEDEDYYGRDRGRMSPARYEDRWRERSPPPRGRSNADVGADREKLEQAKKVQDLLAALKQTSGAPTAPATSAQPYYPPPSNSGNSTTPSFQLPPNMAHLGAILQQAASLPPQQAQAVAGALSQYQQPQPSAYPGMPPQYPSIPPPQSSLYPSSGPPPSGQYGYPPPPGGANPSPPYPGGADIYALLGQKSGPGNPPPPSGLPPDTARYNYGTPNSQGGPTAPPPGASGSQPHSIQDIMALLKRST